MAPRSMTGFGQAVLERDTVRLKVEIRTVNHRFAEFNTRLPRALFALEEDVRSCLATKIARGRADVYVTLEDTGTVARKLSVDWNLLDSLCRVEEEANRRFTGSGGITPSLQQWLVYPDVLQIESVTYDAEQIKSLLLEALEEACDTLVAMRAREGQRLAADMLAKVDQLVAMISHMATQAPAMVDKHRERLRERIAEWTGGTDEPRVLTEIAMFADRVSIDEELVRLRSHTEELRSSLVSASPVGRRLDFIVQELHREVNTISSKSSDVAISQAVVDAKTLIEQLREQAQNIE